MKIICIGRNYAEHAREFNNDVPENPIFFFKPDTSIITRNRPFFYPGFSENIHYETEIVLRISRLGKNIAPKFAHRYFREFTLGIDFTARDLQKECKKNGWPWEIAKGFEGSAPIGRFLPIEHFNDIHNLSFHLNINDVLTQKGNTANMIFSFEDIISYVSQFVTLKMGDLIFTGTPAGVGPVHINDRLTGFVEDHELINFRVK